MKPLTLGELRSARDAAEHALHLAAAEYELSSRRFSAASQAYEKAANELHMAMGVLAGIPPRADV